MLLTFAYVRGREGWRERREQGEVVKKGGKLYWVEIKISAELRQIGRAHV